MNSIDISQPLFGPGGLRLFLDVAIHSHLTYSTTFSL